MILLWGVTSNSIDNILYLNEVRKTNEWLGFVVFNELNAQVSLDGDAGNIVLQECLISRHLHTPTR